MFSLRAIWYMRTTVCRTFTVVSTNIDPPCPARVFFLCQFLPNLVYYLAPRISQIRCRYLEYAIMIDYRKKHKTLSYLYVLTVTDSRMCTTSVVYGSRGVWPESLLRCTSLLIQVKKRFPHRSAVSCANSSGNVYLTPTYDSACNLAS